MKHLFTGVAIAAVLAISAPAWAQNAPMKPAAPAASKPAATAPMAKKPMARRHTHMHAMRRMGSEDSMTDQLNQQELARIQGGGGAGPAPMSPDRLSGPKIGPK